MAYVKANTAPIFGSRAQAISPMSAGRLGTYLRATFPLPTTSMSTPLRLGLFFDGPYAQYGIQEWSRTRASETLAGEWVPPTPVGVAPFSQGALTYRIDPQTGQYKFYATDLLPRGPFEQNTFQHPVRPALSALGMQVRSRGAHLVEIGGRPMVMNSSPYRQGPVSQEPMAKLRAAFSGALGAISGDCCSDFPPHRHNGAQIVYPKPPGRCCGGCKRRRLGDTCTLDENGIPSCTSDSGQVAFGPPAPDGSLPTVGPASPSTWSTGGAGVNANAPGCTYDANGNLVPGSPAVCAPSGTPSPSGQQVGQTIGTALQAFFSSFGQRVTPTTQPATPGFFSGSTNVLGLNVPNPVLIGGAALIGLVLASGGKRR